MSERTQVTIEIPGNLAKAQAEAITRAVCGNKPFTVTISTEVDGVAWTFTGKHSDFQSQRVAGPSGRKLKLVIDGVLASAGDESATLPPEPGSPPGVVTVVKVP